VESFPISWRHAGTTAARLPRGGRRAGTTDWPLGCRIHWHCLGCRIFLRADEFCGSASRLPNSLPQPPGCRISCRCPPAAESAGAAFAADFCGTFARLKKPWKTNFRATVHAYSLTRHFLSAQIWIWLVQRCYSGPLVPPSRVKFIGQRVELRARGLDGRATRTAVAAGHPEQRGTLSPTNLVP
jgi:hypothetical protein